MIYEKNADNPIKLVSKYILTSDHDGSSSLDDIDSSDQNIQQIRFINRAGKLNEIPIKNIDLHKIVSETDIKQIQAILGNVLNFNTETENLSEYTDYRFLNLFQLAQLNIEHLLDSQGHLSASIDERIYEVNNLSREIELVQSCAEETSEKMSKLKRSIQTKKRIIKNLMHLLEISPPLSDPNTNSSGIKYPCLSCGKLFVDNAFLQKHVIKKHGEGDESSQILLYVTLENNQCIQVSAHPSMTVGELIEKIQCAPQSSKSYLQYKGMSLCNESTLEQCDIVDKSQIIYVSSKYLYHTLPTDNDALLKNYIQISSEQCETAKQIATLSNLVHHSLMDRAIGHESNVASLQAEPIEFESRLKNIEMNLPRQIENYVEENMKNLLNSLQFGLDNASKSELVLTTNCGMLEDDDDDNPSTSDANVKLSSSISPGKPPKSLSSSASSA